MVNKSTITELQEDGSILQEFTVPSLVNLECLRKYKFLTNNGFLNIKENY